MNDWSSLQLGRETHRWGCDDTRRLSSTTLEVISMERESTSPTDCLGTFREMKRESCCFFPSFPPHFFFFFPEKDPDDGSRFRAKVTQTCEVRRLFFTDKGFPELCSLAIIKEASSRSCLDSKVWGLFDTMADFVALRCPMFVERWSVIHFFFFTTDWSFL